MKREEEHLELIRRYIDGTATEKDRDTLQELIRHEPSVRRLYARYANLDATLGSGSISLNESAPAAKTPRIAWFSWRPITAAAAGLALGMFCTSMLFAYAQPKSPRSVSQSLPLADAGFESGEQIAPLGTPTQAGTWSGDFSQVVVAENGVIPNQGKQMLRMMRADHEQSPKGERGYVGEAAQVIDLRPFRDELGITEQMVEVSALFNSIPVPPGPKYEFAVKAAAFRGNVANAPSLWKDYEETVSRADRHVIADTDVTTWQRVMVSLMVPPDADFMIVDCAVVFKGTQAENSVAEFPGHYVDQVEARVRAPNPVEGED